jgi:hypothetical protein
VPESSDQERVRLVLSEMLAAEPSSETFEDPAAIRRKGGWRWRPRLDLKVVVALAAVIILIATLVWAGPLRPGSNKQRVATPHPTLPTVTTPPPTSAPVTTSPTTVPTTSEPTTTAPPTTVPIDSAIGVYGNCTTPTVEPTEIVLACADYGERLTGLYWTSWTPTSATAIGTLVYNDCTPDCAAGHFHSVPNTTVTLTVPVRGPGGGLVWSEVQESPEPPGYETGPFHGGPQPLPTQPV